MIKLKKITLNEKEKMSPAELKGTNSSGTVLESCGDVARIGGMYRCHNPYSGHACVLDRYYTSGGVYISIGKCMTVFNTDTHNSSCKCRPF